MRTLEQLIDAVQREASRAPFPVDAAVYQRTGKDPTRPVLCAGELGAPVCIFARDLGRDEVAAGQPLVGAGGRLVRQGLCKAFMDHAPPKSDAKLEAALKFALLSNTVPYKPPGNKAYPESVKERFRPFLVELLAAHWTGDVVLTLGTEAFRWFDRYAAPGAADALWAREDRYETGELDCELTFEADGRAIRKAIRVAPLPHPSPLNQRWYKQFPDLLARRLAGLGAR